MWTRAELKTRAKNVLRTTYWNAFLISLVIAIFGAGRGFNMKFSWGDRWNAFPDLPGKLSGFDSPIYFFTFFMIFLCIGMFFLAIKIFVGYHLEVGGRRFFIQSIDNNGELSHLGYGFKNGNYIGILTSMLWRGFINTLWYFALIIPGIVKSYAYRMVPYILAENPNIGYKRALRLSEQMTIGHKWDMFVLDLSFIGWYLLGVMACCIGVFFVHPYFNATYAELYIVLRNSALEKDLCSYSELNLNSIAEDIGPKF